MIKMDGNKIEVGSDVPHLPYRLDIASRILASMMSFAGTINEEHVKGALNAADSLINAHEAKAEAPKE